MMSEEQLSFLFVLLFQSVIKLMTFDDDDDDDDDDGDDDDDDGW